MSNYHLRDKTLSRKAKGQLSLMLLLPETWDYTLSGLARISLEGKDTIRAAVVELKKAGSTQTESTSPGFPTQINIENNQITELSSKESFPFPTSPPVQVEELKGMKGKRRERRNAVSKNEMDSYRALIRENTTQVRNVKQYLLTVLFNASVTMESHYAVQVNHDFSG